MKKYFFFFTLLIATTITAQTPVQQALLPWLSSLTPMPVAIADIQSKCYNAADGSCTTNNIAGPTPKKIGDTELKISSTNQLTASMPDTAGVAAVQNMSLDQQREWAAQYAMKQQAAASATVKVPSSAEISLQTEYANLNSNELAFVDSMTRQFQRFLDENDAKMKWFDQQRDEFIKACPVINYGGGTGGPDPACVKKAEANYQQWIADWAVTWFKEISDWVAKKKTEIQSRFSKAEGMLASNNYFLTPTNDAYRVDAAAIQLMILDLESSLCICIGKAWEKGCDMNTLLKDSHGRCGETY